MKKKHLSKSRQGLTFIELLLTIAILAILSVMAFASYSAVQKRGRDTKRVGDMKAIQSAFEQYFIDQNNYNADCSVMASNYLQGEIPDDPLGGDYAKQSCADSGYCFCASLEITGSGNSSDDSCSFSSTGDYFCVTNLQ